jgi:hypothetical protein
MSRIIVNLPWVQSTKDDVSSTTGRMREDSADVVALGSSPDVDGGATDFMKKWDERRGDLGDYLQGVEELLQGIYDAFDTTSTSLRDATQDSGGG